MPDKGKKKIKNHITVVSKNKKWKQLKNDRLIYLMLVPVVAWYVLFAYVPMGGITLAFRQFRYDTGLWKSPWVGFEHFTEMFSEKDFWIALKNTILFSLGKLAFHFPTPIILAILLNELTRKKFKKFFQTVFTFPHFISWVVLAGILTNLFASNGSINQILGSVGFESVSPLLSNSAFRPFIWISNIWKEIGWDSIIYLAALTSIDPCLYEAASIDGASRWQKIVHISWPGIKSTVIVMFILAIGSIMSGANFDQIFNLYSAPVFPVADILDTYVYRKSFLTGDSNLGYTTAVGLLKSVVGAIMIIGANKIVSKNGYKGLY